MNKKILWLSVLSLSSTASIASDNSILSNPEIGVVLDGIYQDGIREFSHRQEGFSLGHSEISISASIDDKFRGVLTTMLESHEGKTEIEMEEAFIESLAIPWGLKVKAGRFLSSFGYLNEKHVHEDAFSERPGAYRALLGGHYFDDGVQLSWLAPTDFYLALTGEAFSGKKLDAGFDQPATVGVYSGAINIGADVNASHSWMFGLSALRNGNGQMQFGGEHDHDHAADEHEEHDHAEHSHGPAFTGENLLGADFTWKWAPQGNYKYQNIRFTTEYLQLNNLYDTPFSDLEGATNNLNGFYATVVYQFTPNWSVALRGSEFDHQLANDVHGHGDHAHGDFSDAKLREYDFSLAWISSHFGQVRGQYSRQETNTTDDNIFSLQYVMTFGAHASHAF
ncbi:MAG: TonB-dependent receptor [Psychromonas sp.]|nr:TonB-dependent receptor [Alteromonadales bacterium]MCP5076654.1 TonB-dependent receptor [Psychromonas sp.]